MANRIIIGGGSGLIGQRLTELLLDKGHEVIWLSHSGSDGPVKVVKWDPVNGYLPEDEILRSDYVINLAGAGIADKKWTEERKELIIKSRTAPNELLAELFKSARGNVKAYISASAMGIYGDRGDEWCHEEDEIKLMGFLSKSVHEWEGSIRKVQDTGVRTVYLRTGMVLSTQGGALQRMLPSMKAGIAVYFGDGQHYISWIHIDDIARMYVQAMEEDWQGPYNATASQPRRMRSFTKQLIKAHSGYQVAMPAPAFGLRWVFGEMADALLSSTRMSNSKIKEAGFELEHDHLKNAFQHLLEQKI